MKEYSKEELENYSKMYVTLSDTSELKGLNPKIKKIKLSELCSLVTQINAYKHIIDNEDIYKEYLEQFKKKFEYYPNDIIKDQEHKITGNLEVSVIDKLLWVRNSDLSVINNDKLNILTFDEYKQEIRNKRLKIKEKRLKKNNEK